MWGSYWFPVKNIFVRKCWVFVKNLDLEKCWVSCDNMGYFLLVDLLTDPPPPQKKKWLESPSRGLGTTENAVEAPPLTLRGAPHPLRSAGEHSTKVNRAFGPARFFFNCYPEGPTTQARLYSSELSYRTVALQKRKKIQLRSYRNGLPSNFFCLLVSPLLGQSQNMDI